VRPFSNLHMATRFRSSSTKLWLNSYLSDAGSFSSFWKETTVSKTRNVRRATFVQTVLGNACCYRLAAMIMSSF
uniref:Uncharacterized protein n=1 Tax=Aegilops tauschii subsp. strangulata TaxID=200361 RepID=A0A453KR11_AEGTS